MGRVPRKAAFLELMTTDEGNWFTVAEVIGGCTVEELKARMSNYEFLKWCVHLRNQADDANHRR